MFYMSNQNDIKIYVLRWVGVRPHKNSIESVTVAIRMVIEQVNVKSNQSLKVNVTIVKNKDTNLQSAKLRVEPNKTNCESNIWMGLQHMV